MTNNTSKPYLRFYDADMMPEFRYPATPVIESLRRTANFFGDMDAIWYYGYSMTYRELLHQANRMANSLLGLGLEQGDRIGFLLPTCPQFVVTYWAAISIGLIIVNMNPQYTIHELQEQTSITEPSVIITLESLSPIAKTLKSNLNIPHVIVTKLSDPTIPDEVRDVPPKLPDGWYHYSEMVKKGVKQTRPPVDTTVDDLAIIQFTGGTTGTPKGATLTQANVNAFVTQSYYSVKAVTDRLPDQARTILCVLPFFHVFGQMVMTLGATIPATLILLPRFEIEEVMDTIAKFDNIFMFPAVAAMISAVFNHPRAKELDLSRRIGYIHAGGGPCPEALINRMRDENINLAEGWGMSELSSRGITSPFFGVKKIGSAGVPDPNTTIRIVDPDTFRDRRQGESGEILVKGDLVMKGYWNNPQETEKVFVDGGWLRTGDVAYQDRDGYVFIVDRTKDMIIAGGFNIYPREIDEVLFSHPKILDVMTIGVLDEYRGETVKSVIQLKPGETATVEEIKAFCAEKLAPYKVPKIVEFRDVLPRSAIGKALKRVLRDEVKNNQE